jgi:ketosteroid isomerase-like protein
MSEDTNISVVQDLYAALSKGDLTTFLDAQASLAVSGSHHAYAREHTGTQDISSYVPFIQGLAGDITIVPETVAASGDQVLAVIHVQGTRSGRALDVREVQVFTLTDDGKITQITNYTGDQQAKDDFFS